MGRRVFFTIAPMLLLAATPCPGQCLTKPLAAVPVGQTNSVCLGIEITEDQLATKVTGWRAPGTNKTLIESALSRGRLQG